MPRVHVVDQTFMPPERVLAAGRDLKPGLSKLEEEEAERWQADG
ncbi:MAG TPA: hypothetical protein VFZ41_02455 [Solirubrobacterales bacterium]